MSGKSEHPVQSAQTARADSLSEALTHIPPPPPVRRDSEKQPAGGYTNITSLSLIAFGKVALLRVHHWL
jgi:hypothetical protein